VQIRWCHHRWVIWDRFDDRGVAGGRIDACVNSAGVAGYGALLDLPLADLRLALDVDLCGYLAWPTSCSGVTPNAGAG
jgi:NAD(P)-dependent dehydrogenase (short-subunit alcohol dehydrogenase family)